MQKGSALVPLLVGFLIVGALSVGGYYFYNQQKLKSINSFEDCAKYYPVMESYPEQCATPDGKHFTREVSEEEKEKLKPAESSSQSQDSQSSFENDNGEWKTFRNKLLGVELLVPSGYYIKEESSNEKDKRVVLALEYRPKGQNLDTRLIIKRHDEAAQTIKLLSQPTTSCLNYVDNYQTCTRTEVTKIPEVTKQVINGVEGTFIKQKSPQTNYYDSESWVIFKDKGVLIHFLPSHETHIKDFEEIISSIKFLK